MTDTITSTGALSNTILLSSGANALDVAVTALVVAGGLALFLLAVVVMARWVPVR